MKSENDPAEPKQNRHWILWTLVAVFVIGAIAVMVTVDNFYAGDSEASPHAAGAAGN